MPGLRRHYTSTLAANAAILLLGVVSGVLAARLLGPGGRGELAVIVLWPTTLTVLGNLGMNQAVTFFSAREPARRPALFSAALAVAAGQTLLLMGLGYFLLPRLLGQHSPQVVHWARLFLLLVPLSLFGGYLLNFLQGSLHLGAYNFSRIFVAAWYALVLVMLLVQQLPDLGAIIRWQLAGYGMMLALNLFLVLRLLKLRWHWDSSVLRPVLSYGAKTQLGGLTSYLNLRLDQLVMSVWLPPEALGYYVVAVALASPLTIVPNAIGIVTLPAAARETPETARRVIRQSLRTVLLLLAAGAALLFLLVPYLLPFFFGREFAPAVTACRVLVVAMVPLGLALVLYECLRALNHPLAPAYAEGAGNLVTVALLAWLLPRHGFLGAAYASLGAYTASLLAVLWYIRKHRAFDLSVVWRGNAAEWNPFSNKPLEPPQP